MRAPADPPEVPIEVTIGPMRRRHVREVLAIERQVYPRPWSAALFFSEIAQKVSRCYIVAHHGRRLVGYGGLMCHLEEGHVTTIAVDPQYQRRQIGSRLLLALIEEACRRSARSVALEVRVANWTAQRLYARFGFRAFGLRRGYYAETGEDALVMWIEDLTSGEIKERLARIRRRLGA